MNIRPAQPLEAIAGFAALLREHGLKVGIAEQQAMVRAALSLPLDRWKQVDAAWRAIACHDARDWRRWAELFERYWHPQRLKGSTKVSGQTRPNRSLQQLVQSLHEGMAGGTPPPQRATSDVALNAPALPPDEPGQGRAQPESLEEGFKPVLGLDIRLEGKAVEDASVEAIEVARGWLFMALESDRPAQGHKGLAIVIRMHADSSSNSPTNRPATAGVHRTNAT